MIAQPYWITSRLAIVPRPRGEEWLDDEMLALQEAGIDVLVSMLQADEARELGLGREASSAREIGLTFLNFPVPDVGVPLDASSFARFLEELEHLIASGRSVGVHCRACIGRASITSASLLIRSGVPPEDAWRQISATRGCSVPDTIEQRDWVDRHMSSNL
jgi:protein-tyrosine phosphatase